MAGTCEAECLRNLDTYGMFMIDDRINLITAAKYVDECIAKYNQNISQETNLTAIIATSQYLKLYMEVDARIEREYQEHKELIKYILIHT